MSLGPFNFVINIELKYDENRRCLVPSLKPLEVQTEPLQQQSQKVWNNNKSLKTIKHQKKNAIFPDEKHKIKKEKKVVDDEKDEFDDDSDDVNDDDYTYENEDDDNSNISNNNSNVEEEEKEKEENKKDKRKVIIVIDDDDDRPDETGQQDNQRRSKRRTISLKNIKDGGDDPDDEDYVNVRKRTKNKRGGKKTKELKEELKGEGKRKVCACDKVGETYKSALFILSLYSLGMINSKTENFKYCEIEEEKKRVQEMFKETHFYDDGNIFSQNISDCLIIRSYNRYKLSENGKLMAKMIWRELEEKDKEAGPLRKRQKSEKYDCENNDE